VLAAKILVRRAMMGFKPMPDDETAKRRDDALKRALSTKPKRHKEMKKIKERKNADDYPPTSGDEKGD
jgi:hypothetical protein